jgi:phage recombination protein Bet
MSTDLAVVDRPAPLERPVVITSDQVALVKAVLAPDATDAELQLFFYDCQRRGVHPLDKLIHFTKRKGKYTPVTSIDFFRSRAERTHEHMGTDDAVFTGTPASPEGFAATVTVYRMVQGEKCPFTATARFLEFAPAGDGNDFMWKKMPFNQIAKCAEAQALRRGFPQELNGLHIVEEMEHVTVDQVPPKTVRRASERSAPAAVDAEFVTQALKVKNVRMFGKDNYAVTLVGQSTEYTTRDKQLALDLEGFKGTDHLVTITFVKKEVGEKVYHNLVSFACDSPPSAAATTPMTSADIPFGK